MIRPLHKIILLITVILSGSALRLSAQVDYYWTGASPNSTNWSDAGNWTIGPITTDINGLSVLSIPASAPTATDNVFFASNAFLNSGDVVTIDGEAACANLTWLIDPVVSLTLEGASSSSLTVNGDFLANGNIDNQFFGTTIFAGTGSINTNLAFNTLVQITGNRTLTSSITLKSLSITSGTLNDGGFTIVGNAAGTLSMAGGTTLNISTSFPTAFIKANISLATSSNIVYNSNAAQTVSDIPDYGNLTISGSNVKTLAGTTIVNGDLTILGSTLHANGKEIKLAGNWISHSGTFVHGNNLVTFQKNAASSISTKDKFYNLTVNKTSNTVNLSSPISIDNNLTISSGKLADGGNLITGNTSGTTTMTMTASTELLLTSSPAAPTANTLAVSPMPQFGTYNFSATSSVTYGGGTQSVRGMALAPNTGYGNLIIEGNGIKTLSRKDGNLLRGDTKIQGDLTIRSGSTLLDEGWTLEGPGTTTNKTLTIEAGGALTLKNSGTPMPIFKNYTLASTSTVTYGGTTQNVAGLAYGNLIVSGSGTKTLVNTTSVANNLTIETGATLADGGFQISGNSIGKLTVMDGAQLTISTASTSTTFPTFTSANVDLKPNSTVVYAGYVLRTETTTSGGKNPVTTTININGQVVRGGITYGNLTLTHNQTGTAVKTLDGPITIQGNLDIQAGNTLDVTETSYSISLQGNWGGSGSFEARLGTVRFYGNKNSLINTSNNVSLYNLTIDKDSKANSVTLNTMVRILAGGTATFRTGIVKTTTTYPMDSKQDPISTTSPTSTSPGYLLIFSDNASVTGASHNSHVDGYVRKEGNDSFEFPIGNGAYYRPAGVTTKDNGVFTYDARYINRQSTGDTRYDYRKGRSPVAGVSEHEYWHIVSVVPNSSPVIWLSWEMPISGGGLGNPNYDSNYINKNNVWMLTSAAWLPDSKGNFAWENRGKANVQILDANPATFRGRFEAASATNTNTHLFSIGSIHDALPVELVYFKATLVEKRVELDWATTKEINNDYFTIEKSKDGKNFTELTTVNGQGNSMQITKYTSIDYMPYNGVTYYRLKQTDMDGTYNYSKVVSVQTSVAESNALQVYQSASKQLQVSYISAAEENGVLTIHDSRGIQVWAKEISGSGVQREEQVNLQSASSGMYMVSLQMPSGKVVKRVVIY